MIEYSPDQQSAMHALKSGQNVFLTGKAGTGKTTILNRFIEWAIENKKNMIVCASTGAAAQRITATKACTIHRAFGLKKEPIVPPPKKAKKEIAAADIIIVDEISMCRIDLFEHIAYAIQFANRENESREMRLAKKEKREPVFKTIQLIVTGDFSQLEPVLTSKDREVFRMRYKTKLFAFESRMWKEMNFANIELTTVHRTISDAEYTDALNEIRDGSDPFGCVDWFNFNTADDPFTGPDSIILCGKNATATEKNATRLNQLNGEEFQSMAEITGDADMASTNAEYDLRFKIGAKVMMLTNGPGYYNGSFGTIEGFYPNDDDEAFDEGPRVKIRLEDSGDVAYVEKYKWDVVQPVVKTKKIRYKEVDPDTGVEIEKIREEEVIETETVGSVEQFPFKLAWAITIHKSQGMTLKCGVNLYPEFFANGQLYVALSRVDRRDHIYINGLLDYKDLRTSAKVRKFYGGI